MIFGNDKDFLYNLNESIGVNNSSRFNFYVALFYIKNIYIYVSSKLCYANNFIKT